ncbi:hypothetical protein P9G84_22240 [Brevibacillus centrosporus]|uniref:hypothetical protein n=1 Tax=Brevibacillus centrosporus TaxID=54910 RepID=UPI000F09C276|nr:hypothetical protein [Brevibacillus centrosporus]MEC2131648.1 hypothetical protein [Brevibacillus centrosporus]RNB63272.1 hypothetical protein EDM55_29245 [Brevibacillus centrosporus]GED34982.1 hypothetical protein BCE02nite_61230 [Brevibacillus centrosporus]
MSHYFYITPEEYTEAAKNGVDSENLNRRVRLLGWPKEKAIKTPLRRVTDRRKWVEIAKQNGIGYNTFMNRVNNHGWEMERAATEPLQDRRAAAAEATEKIRKIPRQYILLAEQNGIAYHTLHARVTKLGWDLERAATQPVMSHAEIGRIGAHNVRAKYGDWNRVYLNSGRKLSFSRETIKA